MQCHGSLYTETMVTSLLFVEVLRIGEYITMLYCVAIDIITLLEPDLNNRITVTGKHGGTGIACLYYTTCVSHLIT